MPRSRLHRTDACALPLLGPLDLAPGGALDPTWPLWNASGEGPRADPDGADPRLTPTYWTVDCGRRTERFVDRIFTRGETLNLHGGGDTPCPACTHYRPVWRRLGISHLTMSVPAVGVLPPPLHEPLRAATEAAYAAASDEPFTVPWDWACVELHAVFGERVEGREARLRFWFSPFEGSLFVEHALARGGWDLAGAVVVKQAFARTRAACVPLGESSFGQALASASRLDGRSLLLAGEGCLSCFRGAMRRTAWSLPGWGYDRVDVCAWTPSAPGGPR